ncbi:MAG: glycosyltransferase family 2 protein [Actinomycetota bacterium]|nr:glycosyltransferase family 2 protein [Actinomycetota bacterium]
MTDADVEEAETGRSFSGASREALWLDQPAPSVTCVIPALNEAENIGHVLQRIPAWVEEVIVVDGGSVDGTPQVARRARPGVRVIQQGGRGKGNALSDGCWAATCDVIVMLDADGSTDPGEIPRYLAALRTGADFAKGSRFAVGGGSADITRIRKLGNRGLAMMVNRIWRTNYSDLCYGYNAFWRRTLPDLHLDSPGFEVETCLNIRAAVAGLRIVEVPSFEASQMSGVSNLNARRDGTRVLRAILAEWLRPR